MREMDVQTETPSDPARASVFLSLRETAIIAERAHHRAARKLLQMCELRNYWRLLVNLFHGMSVAAVGLAPLCSAWPSHSLSRHRSREVAVGYV